MIFIGSFKTVREVIKKRGNLSALYAKESLTILLRSFLLLTMEQFLSIFLKFSVRLTNVLKNDNWFCTFDLSRKIELPSIHLTRQSRTDYLLFV